jgi:hypothetical protein
MVYLQTAPMEYNCIQRKTKQITSESIKILSLFASVRKSDPFFLFTFRPAEQAGFR